MHGDFRAENAAECKGRLETNAFFTEKTKSLLRGEIITDSGLYL